MGQKTTQELAREYLELLSRARSWKQKALILASHTSKHLRLITAHRDSLKEALKAYGKTTT